MSDPTKDQIAMIMALHGTPEQQEEARQYIAKEIKLADFAKPDVQSQPSVWHLKPYGWGILADDGRHINYATDTTKAGFCKNMYDALSPEDSPHRVVQLFYKEGEE